MCEICTDIEKRFSPEYESSSTGFHHYTWAVEILREKVQKGLLEFLAGDCPLEDIEQHLQQEDLYTITHYVKCSCGNIFFIGFCCRGRPIGKIVTELPANIAHISSGHYGTYYGDNNQI